MSQTVCQRKRGNSMKVLHLTWKETMLPKLAANEAAAKGAKLAVLLRRRKKRTAVVTGAANDESMLFRPPTTMIMQLSPLSSVPSYTDEHANPRNFTVAKLLHTLEYLRCCNLSAEEEAAHRHQHDCEMMRMAAPLFSLLRSNLSALRRRIVPGNGSSVPLTLYFELGAFRIYLSTGPGRRRPPP